MSDLSASDDRLDDLAVHLRRVVMAMETGVPVVALKDQLIKLHKACLEVVKDADLDPTEDVRRDVLTPSPSGVMIPRPFRPVDMSAFSTASGM
ncbi:MAG: hypothetical protein ACJ735_06150 [Actinomycetes bacterium]